MMVFGGGVFLVVFFFRGVVTRDQRSSLFMLHWHIGRVADAIVVKVGMAVDWFVLGHWCMYVCLTLLGKCELRGLARPLQGWTRLPSRARISLGVKRSLRIAGALNIITTPTSCRPPLNSVRPMVCYTVQYLHMYFVYTDVVQEGLPPPVVLRFQNQTCFRVVHVAVM